MTTPSSSRSLNLPVKRIGKRLSSLSGREIAGFVVTRVSRDSAGNLWSVQVAHLHTPSGGLIDSGV